MKYLKVRVELGSGSYSTMDITAKLGVESSTALSSVRSKLIKK